MKAHAEALAGQLNLAAHGPDSGSAELALEVTADGLQLRDLRTGAPGAVRVDLLHGDGGRLSRAGGQSELLGRAVGARHGRRPTVVDATAGLGGDASVLAAIGCRVTMVERAPVVAALLRDGLRRRHEQAAPDGPYGQLTLVEADAAEWLAQLPVTERPDVVYLDPMYPDTGKTARSRKEMQLLQALLGEEPEPEALLNAALGTARNRVVVKRPRKAPALGGREPSHVIGGKSTRFDVYMVESGGG
ncbi:MAG: class I SAM-dependent methyltransferase [Aquisalimonadaceae bacterium]